MCAIKTNVTVAPRPDAYRRQLSAGAQHGAIFPDTFVDDGCFVDERNRDQHLFYFFPHLAWIILDAVMGRARSEH